MKTVILALIAPDLAACSENNPADAEQVAKQMLKCLKLPGSVPEAFDMDAVVTLKSGQAGMVSINFRHEPTQWEKTAAPAVADAITNCQPYGSMSGRVMFPVTPKMINR